MFFILYKIYINNNSMHFINGCLNISYKKINAFLAPPPFKNNVLNALNTLILPYKFRIDEEDTWRASLLLAGMSNCIFFSIFHFSNWI